MAVLFLLTVIAAVLATTLTMTASDVLDSSAQSRSVEALLLAESGVERALARIAAGVDCVDLAESTSLGSGTIVIAVPPQLDFAGLPLTNRCRIAATGRISAIGGNVERTVDAIVSEGGGVLVNEHFPGGSDFAANWATQVLTNNEGSSAYSTDNCPDTTCVDTVAGTGSLYITTTPTGPNDRFAGYRQRALATNIVTGSTGLTVTVRAGFQKAGGNVNTNTIGVRLFDTAGNVETALWSNAALTTAGWLQGTATVSLPANRTYNRVRLYFNLREQGNNQVFTWIDAVSISAGGGAVGLVQWQEAR